jgi:hypothetical protein
MTRKFRKPIETIGGRQRLLVLSAKLKMPDCGNALDTQIGSLRLVLRLFFAQFFAGEPMRQR